MINSKTATIYAYVTIIILLVMLALVWFGVVDSSFHIPILIFSAVLIVSRIVVRALTMRRGKLRRGEPKDFSDSDVTGAG